MTIRSNLDELQRLQLICEAIRYCQRVQSVSGPKILWRRILREAVGRLWEDRRGNRDRAAQYRSVTSKEMTWGAHELVYEHAIPLAIVHAKLMALAEVQPEAVRSILKDFLVTCIITKNEDKKLNMCGFGRSMPPGKDEKEPLARYQAAGIEIEENPLWAFRE